MSIPRDVGFGLDSFQRPKILSEVDSIAQYILNVLILKPGQLPGLPHIGLNIRDMLYTYVEDFDSNVLRSKIYEQCNELMPHIISSNIVLTGVQHEGKDVFVLIIPIFLSDGTSQDVSYAFYTDSNNQMHYDYSINDL